MEQIQNELTLQRENSGKASSFIGVKKVLGYHLPLSSKNSFDISNKIDDRKMKRRLLKQGFLKTESNFHSSGVDAVFLIKRNIRKINSKSFTQSNVFDASSRLFQTTENPKKHSPNSKYHFVPGDNAIMTTIHPKPQKTQMNLSFSK